ncbi:two-component system regulatory protein YycI [Lactobacillus kalixensis]|uniref:YycH protein n=1 Tax=Lactobacillus kalixensis DSM 16043 TaxID=1423763 RepID=A0A0R1UE68_9LACO|nr:two-component system regulatory protein YycI [Lactobacillus kalixensis]KRL88850.1 YycH protein [Lactobacillus kalixensis DSM 16043]
MDHKRIEWLFLIVFLLIDIYLGIEVLRSPVGISDGSTTNSTSTDIRMEMRADGIELPDNISQAQSSGYYLAAKKRDYLSSKVTSLTQVDATYYKSENVIRAVPRDLVVAKGSKKEVLKALNDFKNDPHNVPYGKQFTYESNMSSDGSYTFVQTSEYGDIYDNSAQLTINVKNGLIDSYYMTYLGPVNPVRELQSTISSWHAVRAMYTNRELANNTKIIEIKLGYSELTNVRGSTILQPTWLVWVENKNTRNITLKRVNAFTGQILQSNTSYNVDNIEK